MIKKDYSNWTKEELIRELEKFKKQKKYGIVWEDKPEQVALMCKKKLPILTEVKDKEIITDKNKPTNILIEGDNYHALFVLNYTHKGKIDVIYIDPPYNTGNKGIMYNDKIVDKKDAYRHSKWLSFMEKRLHLAKNLLSNKGVIFISINDNEVAQLKLLCDETFGEDNFVANLIWKSKSGGAANSSFVAIDTEYILCYCKNKKYAIFNKKQNDSITYKYKDKKGKFYIRRLYETGIKYKKSLDFEIILENNIVKIDKDIVPLTKEHFLNCDPPNKKVILVPGGKNNYLKKYIWRWSKNKIIGGLNKNYLIFYLDKNKNYVLMQKQYESFDTSKEEEINFRKTPYRNWIDFTNTTEGSIELNNIFHKKIFNYPKSTKLITYLLKIASKPNSLILDFFAGSGTTGHAVLELNKEDGGNRKFILCTNNENNICTDVCYPRIEKVIKGYKNLKGKWVEGLGGNLKYFKTDFVDAEPTKSSCLLKQYFCFNRFQDQR